MSNFYLYRSVEDGRKRMQVDLKVRTWIFSLIGALALFSIVISL